MAHYLITGGCGFIGSHLASRLVSAGHRLRILDDLSTGNADKVPRGAELLVGDVANAEAVRAAMQGVDGCFHLAAIASVQRSVQDWIGTHRVNLGGMINVLDAARRRHAKPPVPVAYASSAAVYGDNPKVPLAESDEPRPLSAYGADKLGCEQHARVGARVHHVPSIGLRFFNVFGPGQDPQSPYSGVISVFFDRISRDLPVSVHGDGSQTRDFVYVGDVIDVMIAAISKADTSARVVNVCTGRETSILALAGAIGECLGKKPELRSAPPREGDLRRSQGNVKRLKETFFSLPTQLEDGLVRIQAVRASGSLKV